MKWTLEVVLVPVTDLDRAKEFYAGFGSASRWTSTPRSPPVCASSR